MNSAIRRPDESQKEYKERLREERKAEKAGRARLLWDSSRLGTYIRAKHGDLPR